MTGPGILHCFCFFAVDCVLTDNTRKKMPGYQDVVIQNCQRVLSRERTKPSVLLRAGVYNAA